MFNHYSDLYVFDTPLTRKVIKDWCDKKGYSISDFAARFKDRVTGQPMFDIAFAYDPYWEEAKKIVDRYPPQAKCKGFATKEEADKLAKKAAGI